MNPFDLYGPQFLAFYAALTVATMIVVVVLRRRRELARWSSVELTDPYLIAYLRGGKNEVIRTAIISLVDRGLLEVVDSNLQTTAVGSESVDVAVVAADVDHTIGEARRRIDPVAGEKLPAHPMTLNVERIKITVVGADVNEIMIDEW